MVLCYICGVNLPPEASGGSRCRHCLAEEENITDGISKSGNIEFCTTCGRYLQPPSSWVYYELESRGLLALCLRHVKGITRDHKVQDARFMYTEPHSKQLMVKLVLQKEVANNVVVDQAIVVEFRMKNMQCPDCHKSYTKNKWDCLVQMRQRGESRRTLRHLEEIILKHSAHKRLVDISETKEGADVFFRCHADMQLFVSLLKSSAAIRLQESKKLISHDANNTTYRFKRTTCVEICPVCRDDLVILPPKVRQAFGGMPPLVLCWRANSSIILVDPASMQTREVNGAEYWKKPFTSICTPKQLTKFVVLDVNSEDRVGASQGKLQACEAEIARWVDFGQNDERMTVRSHLGAILQPGDVVLGYDVRAMNCIPDSADIVLPLDVYLVRLQSRLKTEGSKEHKRKGAASTGQSIATVDSDDEKSDDSALEGNDMLDALGATESIAPPDVDPVFEPGVLGTESWDGGLSCTSPDAAARTVPDEVDLIGT